MIHYRWLSYVEGPHNARGSGWGWIDDTGKRWFTCSEDI